jgi:hypothetical protein
MRRSLGLTLLALLFTLASLSHAWQLASVALGWNDEPAPLTVAHAVALAAGVTAAYGAWTGARWAPWGALAWGAATAALLASLGPVLDLPDEARPGLLGSAAGTLAVAALIAWYLWRRARSAA